MTSPAIAGPITREPLKRPELSATAFGSSRGPTIWKVSDCRPGASNARAMPPSAASTYTSGSVAVPVSVTTASAIEIAMALACVAMTSLRDSIRSATTPATRPKTVKGTKRQNASAPIASGEPESWMTSQARAMFCIHVPASDTTCPVKKIR